MTREWSFVSRLHAEPIVFASAAWQAAQSRVCTSATEWFMYCAPLVAVPPCANVHVVVERVKLAGSGSERWWQSTQVAGCEGTDGWRRPVCQSVATVGCVAARWCDTCRSAES